MNFVDVGFSNYVESSKILSVNRPDSSPIKRVIQHAKDSGRFLDLTQGKKTRSIITQSSVSGVVVTASAVQTATIIDRINRAKRAELARQIVEKHSEDVVEVTVGE